MDDFKYSYLIKELLDNQKLNIDKELIINEWEIFCEKIVKLLNTDSNNDDLKK